MRGSHSEATDLRNRRALYTETVGGSLPLHDPLERQLGVGHSVKVPGAGGAAPGDDHLLELGPGLLPVLLSQPPQPLCLLLEAPVRVNLEAESVKLGIRGSVQAWLLRRLHNVLQQMSNHLLSAVGNFHLENKI